MLSKLASCSVRLRQRALSGCSPFLIVHDLLGPVLVLLLPSCCRSSGVHWPRLPAYLRSYSSRRRLVFLLFSLPLRLFSSRRAPLMLSCCPFGLVLWQWQLVLLSSCWCVLVDFLPSPFCLLLSSSCPPLIFLLSCCLCCFPRQGLGAAAAHYNNNNNSSC